MDEGPGSIIWDIIIILLLILINAFFSAAELAIFALSKAKLSHEADEGDEKAKVLLKVLSEPNKFLATIQVGITLSGFLASAIATASISTYLGKYLKLLNVPGSGQIAILIVTFFLSYFTLVFGELIPKRIALSHAESLSRTSIKPIMIVANLTLPFVNFLSLSTNFFVKIFHINVNRESSGDKMSEEELRVMIDVGEEKGVINKTEKEMIDGIFDFDDTLVKEIMTPRTNVFAVDVNTPPEEIMDRITEEHYSRIPVYQDDTDNIIGILYVKDLFPYIKNNQLSKVNIRNIMRAPYFVPETKNTDTLFKELQSTKNHVAILIDEYGGFSGIVTIEDLIEEVMGNIFDEYDESDEAIKKVDNNTYVVSGLCSIDDFNEKFEMELPSENIDTIGGFVMNLLGSIPKDDFDKTIQYKNITFKIEKVAEKRIEKLKVYIN